MVHALHEAHRVLKRGGQLIDPRPLSSHPPIDIMTSSGVVSAGNVDETPGVPDDQAADQAIEQVVHSGRFEMTSREKFKLATYWESLDGLLEYATERWTATARIPDEVRQRAVELVDHEEDDPRVRIVREMHLAVYRRAQT